MAENTEALTAIQEDIQDQAGMVTRQIQSEVQQLQDEEIHFFSEFSLECITDILNCLLCLAHGHVWIVIFW